MHNNTQINNNTYARQLTKSIHWVPCRSHTSPHPPTVPPRINVLSAPRLTCTDTQHHTCTTPILCIKTHQPTTPHLTCAITSQLPCQHLSHGQLHVGPSDTLAIFLFPGVLSCPRRGSSSSSLTYEGPFFQRDPEGRPVASQPSPNSSLSSSPARSSPSRSLECGGLRGWQWRGDSQAVLGKDVRVCAGESPPAWGCKTE